MSVNSKPEKIIGTPNKLWEVRIPYTLKKPLVNFAIDNHQTVQDVASLAIAEFLERQSAALVTV